MNISELLDQLAEYRSQRDALAIEKSDLENKIEANRLQKMFELIPPEVQRALAAIEAEAKEQKTALELEYAGKGEAVDANISGLEEKIKEAVKTGGHTVNGRYLQAVWSKPRVTWDTPQLDAFSEIHPEILPFRKEGLPSVSIRILGK